MRTGKGLALGLLLMTVGLAGCGAAGDDNGVATAGGQGTTSSAAPGGLSDQERALKFARCMRDHDIDMPDPTGDSGGRADKIPSGVDPKKLDAAMQQCKQYQPNGGEPPTMDPEQVQQQRVFAKCMRENGVPDFPDPDSDGTIAIQPGSSSGKLGLDPKDPKFQAAQKACAKYQPGAPNGDTQSGGNG